MIPHILNIGILIINKNKDIVNGFTLDPGASNKNAEKIEK